MCGVQERLSTACAACDCRDLFTRMESRDRLAVDLASRGAAGSHSWIDPLTQRTQVWKGFATSLPRSGPKNGAVFWSKKWGQNFEAA